MSTPTSSPMPRIENSRLLVMPTRAAGWAVQPANRAFKVLQGNREPAQLSLFPPPGQVQRTTGKASK